ncbi:MAG: class I SAM-dependent methyltransferase [Actinomycetota bacterium]
MNAPDGVYARRFGERESAAKERIWVPIARYLQRFVPESGAVIDIGADRGYFIRNIRAAEKWATDIRDTSADMPADVRFEQVDGLLVHESVPEDHFDTVFMSNYLEHLPSPDAVVAQLEAARRIAKPGGSLLVLQPNIALVGAAYWDFIDHRVALTEHSLVEAAELAGWETARVIRRFLPYTTKGRLPASPGLVRAYLAFRPAWWLLGGQTLYLGTRPA